MALKSNESKLIFKRFLENLIKELSKDTNFKTTTDVKYFICDEVLGISISTLNRFLRYESKQQTKLFTVNNQITLNF